MRAADIQQVMIKLLEELGGSGVKLTPGQIVSVLVREVQGQMAQLNYQGINLLAKLEVDVPAGQRLKCLVEGEKDGQLMLRVLQADQGGLTGQTVKNILAGMGLADSKLNKALVMEMLRQEMPLIPDTAKLLSAFGRSVGLAAEDAWIPVMIQEKGLPLTPQTMQTVRDLVTDLSQLQAAADKLFGGTAAGTGDKVNPLLELARSLSGFLQGIQIQKGDTSQEITAKLAAVFKELVPDGAGRANPQAISSQAALPGQSAGQGQGTGQAQSAGQGQGAGQTQAAAQTQSAAQTQTVVTGTPVTGGFTGAPEQAASAGQVTVPQQTASDRQTTVPQQTASAGQTTVPQQAVSPGQTTAPQQTPPAVQMAAPQQTPSNGQTPGPGPGTNVSQTSVTQAQTGEVPGPQPQQGSMATGEQYTATLQNPGPDKGPETIDMPSGRLGGQAANRDELTQTVINRLLELADKNAPQVDGKARQELLGKLHEALGANAEKETEPVLPPLIEKLAAVLKENVRPEFQELAQLADKVLGRLETMQNLNRAQPDRDNVMMVYSTVRFEDREEPVRVLINYRHNSREEKRDFSVCRVEVKLHTPLLGLVRCEVQVDRGKLTLQFTAENEKTVELIERSKGVLEQRLQEMDYQVRFLPGRVQAPDDTADGPEQAGEPRIFRVNLRV